MPIHTGLISNQEPRVWRNMGGAVICSGIFTLQNKHGSAVVTNYFRSLSNTSPKLIELKCVTSCVHSGAFSIEVPDVSLRSERRPDHLCTHEML